MFWIIKKLRKENEELKNELNKSLNNIFIIWVINKYTKEDLQKIWSDKEVIKSILKYLEYNIAKSTDKIRNLNDWISTEQKIWYINCLHEIYIFFSDFLKEEKKNEKYTWQDLI